MTRLTKCQQYSHKNNNHIHYTVTHCPKEFATVQRTLLQISSNKRNGVS